MTTVALSEILKIAVCIAVETPKKRTPNSPSAYVSWTLIEDLRAALTAQGYDLDKVREHMNRINAERRERARSTT